MRHLIEHLEILKSPKIQRLKMFNLMVDYKQYMSLL